MKQYYGRLFIVLVLLTACLATSAQITVEIIVKRVSINYSIDDHESYGGRFRFYYNDPSDACGPLMHPFCGDRNRRCIQTPWGPKIWSGEIWNTLNPIYLPAGTTRFTIYMRTHHERQKDCTSKNSYECTVENLGCGTPDRHETLGSYPVDLAAIPPGKLVPLTTITNNEGGSTASAELLIRYSVSTPKLPEAGGTNFCADKPVILTTDVSPNRNELRYEWQYALPEEDYEIPNPAKDPRNYYDPYVGECGRWEYICEEDPWEGRETCGDRWLTAYDCDLPATVKVHTWRNLTISNSANDNFATFTPLNAIFGGTLTTKRNAFFRVRAVSSEGKVSAWSAEKPLTFLPPAPTIFADKLLKKASCASPYNGQIQIPAAAIQTPHTQVRWLLKDGDKACDIIFNPDGSTTSTCGDGLSSVGPVNVPKNSTDAPIVIDNLSPGNYYLWVVNPGETTGNCYSAIPITIPRYDELQLVQDATSNVSCFGGSNGSFKVHATGGDAASGYQFKLTATTNTHLNSEFAIVPGGVWEVSGLPADEYRIELKNTCTPIKTLHITITQPIEVKAELTTQQPTCNAPSDGKVTATVTQGGGRYVYQLWKGGVLQNEVTTTATTQTWETLQAGVYSVKVLDADRIFCTGWSGSVTLSAAPAIDINTLSVESVSCFEGSDGKVTVTAKGGKGSYGYQLRNTTTAGITSNNTGTFTGLPAGIYELTITNEPAVGCSDQLVKTVVMPQRDPLAVSVSATAINCKGDANGVIKAVATGGSGNYEYQWQYWDGKAWKSNSFWFSTDTEITALEPGRYRLIVKDRESTLDCSVISEEVSITEPAELQIDNITITDAVCKADGARIAIAASGGNGGYQYYYSTDDRTTYTLFDAATPIHNSGTYALKVTDSKGCAIESDDVFPIIVPSAPLDFTTTLSNFNGTQVSCKGASNGTIKVNASGGNEGSYTGYTYKLNSGDFQSSPNFDNLVAGTYSVTVRDGRGCEVVKTITLNEPETLSLGITTMDINCFGASTGTINVNTIGGTAPYSLQLNGEAVVPGTFNNLKAGDYSFQVQDANGCTYHNTVTLVNKFPALTITSIKAADIKCFGDRSTIEVATTGGNGVYTYAYSNDSGTTWQPFTATTLFTAGSYNVRVTDEVGCVTSHPDPVVITAPAEALDFTYVLSDYNGNNISCYGGNNGWAQLVPAGGNGSGYTGYTFAWDEGAFQTSPLLEHINAGAHKLKVKDGRGCLVSKTVTFTQSTVALSVALVSKQDVTCQHDRNGAITVKGTGGTGLLRYALNGGTSQETPVFTALAEGVYTVSVIDANNCSHTISVTIGTVHSPIVINKVTVNDIVCKGDKGSVQMSATGGSGSVFFEYVGSDGLYKSFTNGASFTAGHYQLRAKDAAGCIQPWTDQVIITEPAATLSFTASVSDYNGVNISCVGKTDGQIQLTPSGGNGHTYSSYTFAINGGPFADISQFTNLGAGVYHFQVKDGRGCVAQQDVTLQQPAASLALSVARKTDVRCAGTATGEIELNALGGTAPYRYSKDGISFQESATFSSLFAGTYHFIVKDANGCTQPLSVTLINMYPALSASHTVQPVNCFSGTDGEVELTVNGGVAPYSFQWMGTTQTTQHLQHVPSGNYTVTITDAVGCILSQTAVVTQPAAALTATLVTKPACAGSAGGRIEMLATGGTPAYQYSIDNGSSFHEETTFASLVAGAYPVMIKDKNGCTYKTSTVIAPANEMPVVNFLVATLQNALDTLVIREVSVPAPDSVKWAFDPEAVIINGNGLAPQIRFRQPGTYWVAMTGYFKGCDYTLHKTLEVKPYDPVAGPVTAMPVRVIDTAMLTPNPNNGQFDVHVRLNRKQKIILQVLQMGTGKELVRKNYEGTLLIDDRFSLGNVAGGTYVLRIITENDSRDVLFVIAR